MFRIRDIEVEVACDFLLTGVGLAHHLHNATFDGVKREGHVGIHVGVIGRNEP